MNCRYPSRLNSEYGRKINNIDLMLLCGQGFLPAVTILKSWLDPYRRDRCRAQWRLPYALTATR